MEGSNLKLQAPTISVAFKGHVSVNGNGKPAGQGTGAGTSGSQGTKIIFYSFF